MIIFICILCSRARSDEHVRGCSPDKSLPSAVEQNQSDVHPERQEETR